MDGIEKIDVVANGKVTFVNALLTQDILEKFDKKNVVKTTK